MNIKKLSRKEKEGLYNKSYVELHHYWKQSVETATDFSNLSDENLEEGIKSHVNQLRFERIIALIGSTFKYGLLLFIVCGIIGLLIFGVKQLF